MNQKQLIISIFLIILVTFFSFFPVFRSDFIHLDDFAVVVNNKDIQNLSWPNIAKIFSSFYIACYIPLPMLTFALEHHFFGAQPFFYHLDNILLHIANGLLVFWLILLFGEKIWMAFFVAILFTVHPMRVESVAWVTERKDVLYAFFFLLTLISYSYYLKKTQRKYYFLSLFLFVLALFSKVQAIVLPFILLLVDFLFFGGVSQKNLKEKIPFFILTIIFAVVGICAQYFGKNLTPVRTEGLVNNFIIMNYLVVFYLKQLFFPLKLSCWYVYYGAQGKSANFFSGEFLGSLLIVLTLIMAVLYFLKKNKKISFGILFFLITIFPVIKPIPLLGEIIAADRYTYIPSIGLFYLLGVIFSSFKQKYKIFLTAAFIFVVGIFSFLTWQRCFVWRNSSSLWKDVIKNYPYTSRAYGNLAHYYLDSGITQKLKGNYEKAIEDFTFAIKINPGEPLAYFKRGLVYGLKKENEPAIADFKKAIELSPANGEFYYDLAVVYYQKGDYESAWANFQKSRQLHFEGKPEFLKLLSKKVRGKK